MTRFKTLLLREWMQHQRGWLVLLALPLVLFTIIGLVGQAQVQLNDHEAPVAVVVAGGIMLGVMASTLALAWGASLIQAPGLARRDVQDRSIEFWLSLPAGHAQSIAATLLAHLVLLPLAALAVGLVGGLVVTLPIVAKTFGFADWFAMPWAALMPAFVALTLRLALGVVLATLWMAPLVLLTMVASAWLKRWGVPVVAAIVGFGGLALDRLYGNRIVWDVLAGLSQRASQALIGVGRGGREATLTLERQSDLAGTLAAAPAWFAHDAGQALAMLASPACLGAVLVAAGGFALLVLRRQRGA